LIHLTELDILSFVDCISSYRELGIFHMDPYGSYMNHDYLVTNFDRFGVALRFDRNFSTTSQNWIARMGGLKMWV